MLPVGRGSECGAAHTNAIVADAGMARWASVQTIANASQYLPGIISAMRPLRARRSLSGRAAMRLHRLQIRM